MPDSITAPSRPRLATARRGFFESIGIYVERHAQTFVASLGRISRQPLATLMTTAVIGIALALPLSLNLLVKNVSSATGTWAGAVELSVYFKPEVKLAKVQQLADALRQRSGVASVEVIAADDALKEFREFSGFGAALDALTDNPLPHALIVHPSVERAASPAHIGALQSYLQNWPEVDLVQVDTAWVERLQSILDVIRRVLLLAAVLLGVGVVVIVGNTIRLDIENRRTEIEITKLVGGSDAFVRRPFLYSGFWYGLGGSLLAWGLITLGIHLLEAPVNRLAGLYGSSYKLIGLEPRMIGILLGTGAVLGWLGSWLATARHLRAIEPSA
jgi:cell division transport system permease protein